MPVARLECTRCERSYEPARQAVSCECGQPLLARYDLERAAKDMRPGHLALRAPTLWRYRELLPVEDPDDCVSLGEGLTPLLTTPRLSAALGVPRLLIKDESSNPCGTTAARGFALAVSMARAHGVEAVCAEGDHPAMLALAAYAARAGLRAHAVLSAPAAPELAAELSALGARVECVDGPGAAARGRSAALARSEGLRNCGPLCEPYRLEGAKTVGYELAEQLGWSLPDALLYPTATGLGVVALWKAFEELQAMGFVGPIRPRVYAVQAEGCAPIARAFQAGSERAEPWPEPSTRFGALRVDEPTADLLALRTLRDSHGATVTVSDDEIVAGTRQAAASEGLLLSPAGGACVAALSKLKASGHLSAHDSVVLVETASALRHPELLASPR